ncbi:hypothetical protein ACOMHN_058168 [Nucella lapillus]
MVDRHNGHYSTIMVDRHNGHYSTIMVDRHNGHYSTIMVDRHNGHYSTIMVDRHNGHYSTIMVDRHNGHYSTIMVHQMAQSPLCEPVTSMIYAAMLVTTCGLKYSNDCRDIDDGGYGLDYSEDIIPDDDNVSNEAQPITGGQSQGIAAQEPKRKKAKSRPASASEAE